MLSKYEEDFVKWCEDTIEYIKRHEWGKIDKDALIEELEGISKSECRAMLSYTVVILTHLLKIKYQPEKLSKSWINSIEYARINIQRIFKHSPKLKAEIAQTYNEEISSLYKQAAIIFEEETKTSRKILPKVCPFSIGELLNETFFAQEEKIKSIIDELLAD